MAQAVRDKADTSVEEVRARSAARWRAGLLAIAAVAWLVFITVPYLRLAQRPAEQIALRVGREALILAGLGFGLVVLVGTLRSRRLGTLYLYGILASFGLVTGGMLVAGGAWRGALAILWLTALAWAIGGRVIRLLFRAGGGPEGGEAIVFSIAVGFGLFSHAILGLTLAGFLPRWPIVGLLALLSLLLWRDLRDQGRAIAAFPARIRAFGQRTSEGWFTLPLLTLTFVWLGLLLVQAVAPEIGYDALVYHLPLPRLYIEQGRFVLTPYSIQSWFYLGAEMNFLLALLVADQVAAKLAHSAFFLLTVAAIYLFGERSLSRRAGLFGAALFGTAPLLAWEATTANVDLALACYCFLVVVAAWRWVETRAASWLALAGLLAGFAISAKVSALQFFAPLGLVLLAVALRDRRRPWAERARPFLVAGAVALFSAAPWPLVRAVQTGNPVFPFYNEYFKSPLWPSDWGPPIITTLGIGYDAAALLRLPWALTYQTERFHEGPGGVLGLGLLALPLLLLLPGAGSPLPRAVPFLAAILVPFGAIWVFNGHQYLRFAIPALPLVALLAGHALAHFCRRQPRGSRALVGAVAGTTIRVVLLLWVVATLPLLLPMYSVIPERIPLRVALGLEAREAYLSRIIVAYDAYRFLAVRYPGESSSVLALGDEFRLYAPGKVQPLWSPELRGLLSARTPDEALAVLRAAGVTHLLINRNGLPDSWKGYFVLQQPFLDSHTEFEFASKNVEVYRLRAAPGERSGP